MPEGPNDTRQLRHHVGRDGPAVPDPLRVAIVGAGRIAIHHAGAIQRSRTTARVVAVADPDETMRERLRAVCGGARGFRTLEEVLSGESVDVVHVCTPPGLHEQLALKAVQAGCHAYVEKPFALTASAADRVVTLAQSEGVRVCAGHQLLFETPTLRAMALLPALGAVIHVESFFAFRPIRRRPDGRAALPADEQLLDILPHPVYLLLRFLSQASPGETADTVAVEVGPGGTVHALVRSGPTTGTLTVTLDGRPVETYVTVVGGNGSVHADFVRGTSQHLIGPGSSAIDKALNPFRQARQLRWGSAAALTARVLRSQVAYPGMARIIESFYSSIRTGSTPPLSAREIVDTVRVCERIAAALGRNAPRRTVSGGGGRTTPSVVVTGGTGLLGAALVRTLVAQGTGVRVLARRIPADWDRVEGAEYVAADLASDVDPELLRSAAVVVHCAAETAGSWDEHQKNSIGTTEHLIRAAARAGVAHIVHVSSVAVLAQPPTGAPIAESSPLEMGRKSGPYVWGKATSEQLAVNLGAKLGLKVKIVRPAAIVDFAAFDPPGRLGRRLGNWFVAVGGRRERLGVVERDFAAQVLAWLASHFVEAPSVLNILSPALPSKAELVGRLRRTNPDLRVVWLPRLVLYPLSWVAFVLQKVLHPRQPATNVAAVFAHRRYETTLIASISQSVLGSAETHAGR